MQGFYSAEEETALPKPSVMKATPKKAGGEKAKRVSAPQQVAESIKSLAELVPGLALQLTAIQEEQAKMRQDFEAQVAKSSLRPSQAPVSMDLQMLGKVMGPPPRTKNMSLSPPPAKKVSFVPRTDTTMPIQEQLRPLWKRRWRETHWPLQFWSKAVLSPAWFPRCRAEIPSWTPKEAAFQRLQRGPKAGRSCKPS